MDLEQEFKSEKIKCANQLRITTLKIDEGRLPVLLRTLKVSKDMQFLVS